MDSCSVSQLPELLGAGLIAAGGACLCLFVFWELRARYPVLNIKLLTSNRAFAFSNLAALINYGATATVAFLLSLYLQYIKGLTPQQAGLVLVSQPIPPPRAARIFDKPVAAEGGSCALCSHAEAARLPLFRSKAAFCAQLPTFRSGTWWSCFGSAPGCDPGDEGSIPRFTPIVDGSKVPGRAPSVAAGECATPHLRADFAP